MVRGAARPAPAASRSRRPGAPAGRMETAEPATILIRGLAARTSIGITAQERSKLQDVVVDLALDVRTDAGRTDRIDDAVDYKAVKDDVLEYIETSQHHLLEALAQGIADLCLVRAGVESVEVQVDKPGALRFARSVAVRLRRDRLAPLSAAGPTRPRTWGHRG